MLISKTMNDLLNKQINRELFSSYLYLALAAYFDGENLNGFAHWLKLQSQEENNHAMRIYDFVNERGGTVELFALEEPPKKWQSIAVAFEEVYEHEKKVTDMIHNLVRKSRAEDDIATENFLQWFVQEQVEEEDSALTILEKLKKIGDFKSGIIWLDKELARRE